MTATGRPELTPARLREEKARVEFLLHQTRGATFDGNWTLILDLCTALEAAWRERDDYQRRAEHAEERAEGLVFPFDYGRPL
jgi:hypothetical protein